MADNRTIFKKLFYSKSGRLVIIQFPNIPLFIWLICIITNKFISSSTIGTVLSITGTVALLIWAILEIVGGVNYFRRIVGLVVLAYIIYSMF